MRVPWLADVLRSAGCEVWEQPGWHGRGRELGSVEGLVWHHTASSPRTPDTAMAAMLRDGRSDLPGPLAQLGLQRDGTFITVADGRANHNGYGMWGNNSLGIEAYNDGIGEPWPVEQLDAWYRGSAAILIHLGLDVDHLKGHRETDPHRKIDPTGIDLDDARRIVALHMIAQTAPPPAPTPPVSTPTPIPMEDDMPWLLRAKASPTDGLWLIDGDNAINIASEKSFSYAHENSPTLDVVTLDVPVARLFLKTKKAVIDK